MATYSITKEIASQTKVTKGIYLQDFFFLLITAGYDETSQHIPAYGQS